jgi:hypothetical protein
MKAIQVSKPGGALELCERDIPPFKPDWVSDEVHA